MFTSRSTGTEEDGEGEKSKVDFLGAQTSRVAVRLAFSTFPLLGDAFSSLLFCKALQVEVKWWSHLLLWSGAFSPLSLFGRCCFGRYPSFFGVGEKKLFE